MLIPNFLSRAKRSFKLSDDEVRGLDIIWRNRYTGCNCVIAVTNIGCISYARVYAVKGSEYIPITKVFEKVLNKRATKDGIVYPAGQVDNFNEDLISLYRMLSGKAYSSDTFASKVSIL